MTTPTRRITPLCVLVATLALSACDRATAPAAQDPAGDIDAVAVVDRGATPAADAGFDARAFAGTFVADGATLALAADGSYMMTVRAESADADLSSTGTWTVEDDGARLRLDPDSKADPDVVFAIGSHDELAQDDGGRVLRRDGA